MPTNFRPRDDATVVIVGGGLAGVTLADALLDDGAGLLPHQLTIVHHHDERAGSCAPGALMHVSPGRSFAISADQANAFATSREWLGKQDQTHVDERPLLRPNTGPTGARLSSSLARARPHLSLAGVTVEEVGREAAAKAFGVDVDAFECESFFLVTPSFAVALDALLRAARRRLKASGVTIVDDKVANVDACGEARGVGGAVTLSDGTTRTASAVVLACGPALNEFAGNIGEREDGDLVTWPHAPSDAMLTAGGVHGCGPSGVGWVVGATRYRPSAAPTVDAAMATLVERWNAVAPKGRKQSPEGGPVLWRGARLIRAKTRRPLAEQFGSEGSLWVLGGFGATGLLWAPFFARQLSADIFSALER